MTSGEVCRDRTKRQVEIARCAVTEMKTDQCAGPEQRPRWLHSRELVEDTLLERGEPASDGHRSS